MMRILPTVLNHQPALAMEPATLALDIPVTLPHFSGHFPGHPILPGIVQLDWAIVFGQECFQLPQRVRSVERLKFNAPVFPPCQLILTLEIAKGVDGDPALIFSYRNGAQAVSSGRVVFATAATSESCRGVA